MASLRKSIKSFLTVVAFLVLTAIVIVIYGGDDEKKAEMEKQVLYQKSRQIISTIWSAAQGLAELNLSNRLSSGGDLVNRIQEEAKDQNLKEDATAWSGLFSALKGRLAETQEEEDYNTVTSSDSFETDTIEQESLFRVALNEDEMAAPQLVISSRSGREYRLPWPFKKD